MTGMVSEEVTECCGPTHRTCGLCMETGHRYGAWKSHPAWAFEERECWCCGHYDSRALLVGEEEV